MNPPCTPPLFGASSPLPVMGHCAHLLSDAELYIAIVSGRHVWIASAGNGAVLQMLGPVESAVSCVSFCQSGAQLAAAAGDAVTIYTPEGGGTARRWRHDVDLRQDGPVQSLAWATPPESIMTGLRPRVLWVGGLVLARWSRAGLGGGWVRTWCRALAQPARWRPCWLCPPT